MKPPSIRRKKAPWIHNVADHAGTDKHTTCIQYWYTHLCSQIVDIDSTAIKPTEPRIFLNIIQKLGN